MYISELDLDRDDGRPMSKVLTSMRDEVMAVNMRSYGGMSRELSMVIAKLDEARLWAIAHGEKTGSHVIFDKREVLGGQGAGAGLSVAHDTKQ